MVAKLKERAEGKPVSRREVLARAARLESQFEEILDAAADESGVYDLIPIDGMDEPLLEFACRLRCLFLECDDRDGPADDPGGIPEAGASSAQQELLEDLDRLCELAGSSVQLRTTWEDLATRFRAFRRLLIQYLEPSGGGCDRRLLTAD